MPEYFYIGPDKTASKWLKSNLISHADIYMPNVETHFFDIHYYRGIKWYEDTYYSGYKNEKSILDMTNSYIVEERVADRIKKHIPDYKIITCLRNPIERAFSHYRDEKNNWDTLLRENKLEPELRQFKFYEFDTESIVHYDLYQMWVVPGFYYRHLKRFEEFIPKDNMLIQTYDDLLKDPSAYLKNILNFMNISTDYEEKNIIETNVRIKCAQDIMEEVKFKAKREMVEQYRGDVEMLQEYLERDLSDWLKV